MKKVYKMKILGQTPNFKLPWKKHWIELRSWNFQEKILIETYIIERRF